MEAKAQQHTIGAQIQPRRRVATVAQTAAAYPAFTQAALRDLIFKASDRHNSRGDRIPGNGLSEAGAIIRLGRKVLIDLDAFESWLDSRASTH